MPTLPLTKEQLKDYGYSKSRIVDHTLDDAHLERRCPLDNGRHQVLPNYPAGRLDLLPAEIISEILLELDIPSLTTLRRLNHRTMSLVDSLYQYRSIVFHCPNVLRGIVSLNARHYDCRTLYETLCSTKCATCDHFGGYLYLIACKRVCYLCFVKNDAYFPVSATMASRHTGLSRKSLKLLPHIRSLPGRYTDSEKVARGRIMLLDRQSLRIAALKISSQSLSELIPKDDLTTREPRRFMSIVSAPYFTSSGSSAQWGFQCIQCIDNVGPSTHFRIKYTEDEFARHLEKQGLNHGGHRHTYYSSTVSWQAYNYNSRPQ